MSEERTYESAVARIEEIIRRLDSGDAGLRETLELVVLEGLRQLGLTDVHVVKDSD